MKKSRKLSRKSTSRKVSRNSQSRKVQKRSNRRFNSPEKKIEALKQFVNTVNEGFKTLGEALKPEKKPFDNLPESTNSPINPL